MVVHAGRRVAFHDEHAARHTKVNDRRAAAGIEQQVFGASSNRLYAGTGQVIVNLGRYRPTQTAFANNNVVNAFTADIGRNTATACFDFGKFRHAWSLL